MDGGRQGNALERVGVLLARAECLMLEADLTLARVEHPGKDLRDWLDALALAENRLDAARSSLSLARRAFEDRRRNVLWWIRLTQDWTQWGIEAALLNVVGHPLRKSRRLHERGTIGRFEEILGDGLEAVRAGMMSVPRFMPEVKTPPQAVARKEWMRGAGQWLCLLSATYWHDAFQFRAMVDSQPHGRRADAEFPTLFWERWEIVNKKFRLHELVGPDRERSRYQG